MDGGRRARRASDGDMKEGAWEGASFHVNSMGNLAFTLKSQNRDKEGLSDISMLAAAVMGSWCETSLHKVVSCYI